MKIKREYTAPKSIEEFRKIVVREIDGNDEVLAAGWADERKKQKGEAAGNPFLELIRVSIVSVDGKKVNPVTGCEDFYSWKARARNFVMRCYNDLNGLDEEEVKACLKGAMDVTTETSRPSAPQATEETSNDD